MANWTQKKLLLTIGGTAFGVCALAGGGVYYAQGLIEEIELQITAKQDTIGAAERKIAQIPPLEQDVIILRENLGEYVKILPDDKQLNDFVRQLQVFERQSGIVGTGLVQSNQNKKPTGRFTPIEYTYDMEATLWQALKFMNLVENYERFVSIVDFSLQAGGGKRGQDRDSEAVHKVKLKMVTYTYNGASAGQEVQIPDYDNRKAELREEIWKRMQAIRIDRYEHRGQQGRRDIFVDPRERGDQRLEGPSQAEQRAVLEKYIGAIGQLQEMVGRMRAPETTLFEQYSLEKRFKNDLSKLLGQLDVDAGRVSYPPYQLRWAKEIVAPLDELRTQLDSADKVEPMRKDPYLPRAELQQLVAEMANDCNSGFLEQARSRYEAVQERVMVPADDERHDLAVQAKSWHVKAVTALDFKSLDLRVQGVVVNPSGRSGVLLNGETYEEGDYVSDELLVKLVEEEQVWFVFRGLTLVRTM